jgi:hypothetical protein
MKFNIGDIVVVKKHVWEEWLLHHGKFTYEPCAPQEVIRIFTCEGEFYRKIYNKIMLTYPTYYWDAEELELVEEN